MPRRSPLSIREVKPGVSLRANAPRCKDCPFWHCGWCGVTAARAAAHASMCAYGRRRRRSEAVMACRRGKK